MTFTGLTAAFLACRFSLQGELGPALVCLMLAGILDLFDGLVARKMQQDRDEVLFGKQIDTIADMVCFGVVPAIIALNSGLSGRLDFIVQAFYMCCAAMRLGYFNVHGMTGAGKNSYFTGLPVTYGALFFPVVFISAGLLDQALAHAVIRITFVTVGVLFVLKVRVFKPQGIFYFIFPLLAILLSLYWLFRA